MVDLVDLATDGSSLVVVGDGGTILRSDEGAVWSRVHTTATHDLLAVAWGNGRWLVLKRPTRIPDGHLVDEWSDVVDGDSWPRKNRISLRHCASKQTSSGRFEVPGLEQCVVGSADGLRWSWAPGVQYPPSGGSPIGFSDYIARPNMTVALSLPGYDSYYNWYDGAIWVTSWSSPEPDPELSHTWFDLKLRSIAYGRGRFMVVGDGGVILASNPIEPVLNLEIDHAAARLRLTLAGPTNSLLRLEYSPDLGEWSYLGTYTAADPPLWFDLPSGRRPIRILPCGPGTGAVSHRTHDDRVTRLTRASLNLEQTV